MVGHRTKRRPIANDAASRTAIGLFVAMAAVGCSSDTWIVSATELRVSPPLPTVGDEVLVDIVSDGAINSMSATIGEALRLDPQGILEPLGEGRFLAIGAGKVTLTLRSAGGLVFNTSVTVNCPPQDTGATVMHTDEHIQQDSIWEASAGVHHVVGLVEVDGATLTLGACSSLHFATGAALIVGANQPARIIVRGTTDHPIVATGDAGWGGIRLHVDNARGSILRALTLRGAAGIQSSRADEAWFSDDLVTRGACTAADSDRAVLDLVGDPGVIYPERRGEPAEPISIADLSIDGCACTGLRIRNTQVITAPSWTVASIQNCSGFPVTTDAASLGAVPRGLDGGNGLDRVGVIGGRTGSNYQMWRNPGIPYQVERTIVVAPPATDYQVDHEPYLGGVFTVIGMGTRLEFQRGAGLIIGADPTTLTACVDDTACSEDAPTCHLELGRCWNSQTTPKVRIEVQGTLQSPVVFTSAQDAPAPGDWIGILLMPNVGFRNGGIGEFFYLSHVRGAIVEYAGEPGPIEGPSGPREAGMLIFTNLRAPSVDPLWFFEGTIIRHNAGHGISTPTHKLNITPWTKFLGRPLGVPSCVCGNLCDDVSLSDAELADGETTTCVASIDLASDCNCSSSQIEYAP